MPSTISAPNQADLTKLVETIVAALGDNGTAVARKTLEEIIAGTFATDDDKAAVEAALKTLVANPCAENDALLIRVLMDPSVIRPVDRQGPWSANDLRLKTFELIKAGASSDLRASWPKSLPST